jgi:hypothetical protein
MQACGPHGDRFGELFLQTLCEDVVLLWVSCAGCDFSGLGLVMGGL